MSMTTAQYGKVSVFKRHVEEADRTFVNTYEVDMGEMDYPTLAQWEALGLRIVGFERALHYDLVAFERLVISTWRPDSTPYEGDEFITMDLGGEGSIASASLSILPLNYALHVRRAVQTGRSGKLHYRGCLDTGAVETVAGEYVLTSTALSNIQTRLEDALSSSGLDTNLLGGSAVERLCLITPDAAGQPRSVRHMVGLGVAGVVSAKRTRRWYNRGASS
jgi:hypothetical protein